MLYNKYGNVILALDHLSNQDLIATTRRLVTREREATAQLIAALMEIDTRRLYLGEGCSSLFAYCTQVLRLSEHAAYGRIEAARAARKFPPVLERLADGSLTLTAVSLLAPHLTSANHQQVLAGARHRSKREVEQIVAELCPKPPVPTSIRKLPQPIVSRTLALPVTNEVSAPGPPAVASKEPPRTTIVTPLAPERFKVQFTIDRGTHDMLRHAQNLLRHSIPSGDMSVIFSRALVLLVADLEAKKLLPRRVRVRRALWHAGPDTSRRTLSALCGRAMTVSARLSAEMAGAPNVAVSSFIMSCLMQRVERRRSEIFSFAVGHTMSMRQSNSLVLVFRCSTRGSERLGWATPNSVRTESMWNAPTPQMNS